MTAVLDTAIIGGPLIKVCDECLKYGKKVECSDIDKIYRSRLIEVFNIKPRR